MTKQHTTPPAYIWNRIEKILDNQNNVTQYNEKLVSDTLLRSENKRRANFLFAFATGIGLFTFAAYNLSAKMKTTLTA